MVLFVVVVELAAAESMAVASMVVLHVQLNFFYELNDDVIDVVVDYILVHCHWARPKRAYVSIWYRKKLEGGRLMCGARSMDGSIARVCKIG